MCLKLCGVFLCPLLQCFLALLMSSAFRSAYRCLLTRCRFIVLLRCHYLILTVLLADFIVCCFNLATLFRRYNSQPITKLAHSLHFNTLRFVFVDSEFLGHAKKKTASVLKDGVCAAFFAPLLLFCFIVPVNWIAVLPPVVWLGDASDATSERSL